MNLIAYIYNCFHFEFLGNHILHEEELIQFHCYLCKFTIPFYSRASFYVCILKSKMTCIMYISHYHCFIVHEASRIIIPVQASIFENRNH